MKTLKSALIPRVKFTKIPLQAQRKHFNLSHSPRVNHAPLAFALQLLAYYNLTVPRTLDAKEKQKIKDQWHVHASSSSSILPPVEISHS